MEDVIFAGNFGVVFFPLLYLLLGLLPQEVKQVGLVLGFLLLLELDGFWDLKLLGREMLYLGEKRVDISGPLVAVPDLPIEVVVKNGPVAGDEEVVLRHRRNHDFALDILETSGQCRGDEVVYFLSELCSQAVEGVTAEGEGSVAGEALGDAVGQHQRQLLNLVQDLMGHIMRVPPLEEIQAEKLGRDGVPETSGCEGVVRVHFVLQVAFLIINLFQIIDDFYISLDRRLLLPRGHSFPRFRSLLPFLFLLAFLAI